MEPPFTTLEKGARTMKSLTGMGGMGNARELAEMLRQLGRGRDTVLAHITPEEAQMLMDAGGSGDINPNTGLPEFQDADIQGNENFYGEPIPQDVEAQPGGFYGQTERATFNPYTQETRLYNEDISTAQPGPDGSYKDFYDRALRQTISSMPPEQVDIGFGPGRFAPEYTRRDVAGMAPDQFQRQMVEAGAGPGLAETIESKLGGISDIAAKYPRLAQAAGYSAQGLVGMLNAARMRKQGREEAARLSALGAPLRAQGESLRQQALSGTLTPQQAAQQEAARARLRQTASGRGAVTGTQAGMIESQLGRQRSELSQINLNNALKQLNLANAYDEGAIRAKLASDREADDLLATIAGNIGAQLAGKEPEKKPPRPPRPESPLITKKPEVPRGE